MADESTDSRPGAGLGKDTAGDVSRRLLDGLVGSFARQRTLAERALDQVADDDFFTPLGDEEANSPAILVKHVGGNLRSRFTDFLTTDGEKPDRHRDREFVIEAEADSRQSLMNRWATGWGRLESSLQSLTGDGLSRTVTIRGEAYSVIDALLRAHDHIAYHVGQIVLLARTAQGEDWRTLSVPRGGSAAYLESVRAGTISQRTVPAESNEKP